MYKTTQMTHKERVIAALKKEDVDRIPCCVWGHYPEVDQDPIHNAETMLNIAKKFNYDWIKLSPDQYAFMQDFGLSVCNFGNPNQKTTPRLSLIRTAEDWKGIKVLSAEHGMWGKTVDLSRYMQKFQKEQGLEIPYLATINSPLTTLAEIGGVEKTMRDMREYPDIIKEALQNMTDTAINYIKASLECGIAGFFFTSRYCSSNFMTLDEYMEFGYKYDVQLFKAYEGQTYFNMNHIHGTNTYWEFLANYPFNCINWHDTWVPPTLEEARKITDKCLCGGLSEKEMLPLGTPDEIHEQIKDVVRRAGRKGLMITNGCGTFPTAPEANMYAVSAAVLSL